MNYPANQPTTQPTNHPADRPVQGSKSLADSIVAFVSAQGGAAWLVGGYVRDRLLGRPGHDLDLVVPEGGIRLARAIAAAFSGMSFVLDNDRDVGRAILPAEAGDTMEVDVARLRVPDLLDDLALRDFTINAIAMDISATAQAPRIFDPFDGQADLTRGLLRAVTEGSFRDDPLRMLRGVRMAIELGFRIEDATFNLIRRDAALIKAVSAERVRDEMMRIVAAPGAWRNLSWLNTLGLLGHILPESTAQIGVTQSPPHYQDVFDHSRSVVAHLVGLYALLWPDGAYSIPRPVSEDATVPAGAAQWAEMADVLTPYAADLRAHLALPLASGHSRRDLLMWAAVTHDWGKPARRTADADGQAHFYDHDRWGALLAEARMQALRFSGDEVSFVARLTDLHMRPSHLAHDFPPTRKAIYRFFRDAGNTGPECALLSLADHAATQPTVPDPESWQRRLVTTHMLLDAFFSQRPQQVDPVPLLNGRQIMEELGLQPGPHIGELLEVLREAQAAGELTTPDQALDWLRTHGRG